VQRVVDVLMALPAIILALALMAVLGPRLENVVLAIAIVVLPGLARVVRGVVLQLRAFQFVEAARALGASDARLLLRHLLPNAVAPVIVLATNALSRLPHRFSLRRVAATTLSAYLFSSKMACKARTTPSTSGR
jgi:ABC-type dipeptide/oligopeptide/nickel transport system permease subunit